MVLPNVSVEQPGTFYDAKVYIFKIAPFQLNNNDAAIRFFVKESKLHIEKALKVEIDKNTIIIDLDHAKLLNKSDLADTSMPSAAEVISKTKVRNNISNPVPVDKSLQSRQKEESRISSDKTLNLKKYLNIVAGFTAIIMFFFLGYSVYKNRSGDVSDLVDITKDSIKTLATYPISPKQQLKLVEVAGEKILLGVSGDSISYLKTVDETQQHNSINVVENKPLKIDTSPKSELQLSARSRPAASKAKKSYPISSGVENGSNGEGNIAMKMLSKQDKDYSDVSNVEIKQKKSLTSSIDSSKKTMVKKSKSTENNKAVEDVTKLIRKKLQNLPKV